MLNGKVVQNGTGAPTPPCPAEAYPATHPHRRAVRRVVSYMRANLNQPQHLEELAEVAYCSRWHLVRLFSEHTGVTPMNFLSALRIEAAKSRLLTTDEKVIDIAYDVGFNSLGSFGKRFTALVGVPPRALRNASRRLDGDSFRGLIGRAVRAPPRHSRRTLVGEVRLTAEHAPVRGHAFLGLFAGGIPSGRPVCCAVAAFPGPFAIYDVPDGRYTLLAAGLPLQEEACALLRSDRLLLGHVRSIPISDNGTTVVADVSLDGQLPEKPPVLLALPLLLEMVTPSRNVA